MKSPLFLAAILLTVPRAQAQTPDGCQVAVDNLIRWSQTPLTPEAQRLSLVSCREAVATGEISALEAVRCLSKTELSSAVECMSQSILTVTLSQCDGASSEEEVASCREEVIARSSELKPHIEDLIRSGHVLGGTEVPSLPDPPSDPGSCTTVVDHVIEWADMPKKRRERKKAIAECESDLAGGDADSALVIMCLSLETVDQASDCLVTEAIRANMGECSSPNIDEQAMCIQMLIDMIEPMKAELRDAILDGSLMD